MKLFTEDTRLSVRMIRFWKQCRWILVFGLVVLCGCGGGGSISPPRGSQSWTIMVFLNGANDLDEFSDTNVNQMEESMLNPAKVKVVVQWKRISQWAPPGSWTGTRRYLVRYDTHPGIGSELLADMGQGVDMGSADTLREFVQWARTTYPADRYVLVIWNHGSGWRSTRKSEPITRGVSFDDEFGTNIKTWELPQAIRPSAADPMMDLLVFDASLMQMIEVVYECRGVARYVVGSEESPPGEGYPYHRFLVPLAQNTDMSPAELAGTIVQNTVAYYAQNFPHYGNITQSAVDTSRIESVATALDSFAGVLMANRASFLNELMSARQQAQSYSTYPEYKDLWHVAQLIKQNTGSPAITASVNQLQSALSNAIVSEAHANNARVGNSHGLSIYYPSAGDFLGRYTNLSLARATRWDEWLLEAP